MFEVTHEGRLLLTRPPRVFALLAVVTLGIGCSAAASPPVQSPAADTAITNEIRPGGEFHAELEQHGAELLVVATLRCERWEIDPSTPEAREKLIDRNLPCDPPRPLVSAPVDVVRTADGEALPLGQTNASGVLQVNLSEALPREWLVGSVPLVAIPVRLGDVLLGTIDPRKVRDVLDERAYAALDLEWCGSSADAVPCGYLEAYLQDFPGGLHQEQVGRIFSAVATQYREAVEESWDHMQEMMEIDQSTFELEE